MKGRKLNKNHLEYIRNNYPDTSNRILAERLGVAESTIINAAKANGITKTAEFLQGECCRFLPGHIPANKGKKLPDHVKEKTAATQFKKGHVPQNVLPDGSITIRRSRKGKKPYKWIRLTHNNWKMLQVYNWEQMHGTIPEDKIIVAIDGDTLNCEPDNWMMIDRARHLDRNAGRSELTDKYVISKLASRNRELRELFGKSPELIKMKRNQIKLRRELNELD